MPAPQTPVVIALGGNAISPLHAEDDIPHQFATARRTAARIADLLAVRPSLVITHGNGPQVGNVLRRVELAAHELYTLPLDVCVADTQAGMGYMITQCLRNELAARGAPRPVAALVTAVEVAPDDPAFGQPTKPIGRAYDAARAAALGTRYGWQLTRLPDGSLRRVVASPAPRRVVELAAVRALLAAGVVPVVAGGGGIPVVCDTDGAERGVEAVVDKDRTAALLARELDAGVLLIATDVPAVMRDFGTPRQRPIERLALPDARRLYASGELPAGSIGPKLQAAIDFVAGGQADAAAVICSIDDLPAALDGRAGTRIERE